MALGSIRSRGASLLNSFARRHGHVGLLLRPISTAHSCLQQNDQGPLAPVSSTDNADAAADREVVQWAAKRSAAHKLLGKVQVKGGAGGDGSIAYLREAGRPKGPPAGGNGGRGGSIYFVATSQLSTLRGIRTKYVGAQGAPGHGKMMHGRNAQDLVVDVPVGTVITEISMPPPRSSSPAAGSKKRNKSSKSAAEGTPGEREDILQRLKRKNPHMPLSSETDALPATPKTPLGGPSMANATVLEFNEPGQVYLVAAGGSGGFGNIHFSSTHCSPRERSLGQAGQERTLRLELKTIADVGLVGLPNAGKSSVLNAISNADSRVAPYPFTTLNPFLGTIEWPASISDTRTTVADIPGLVAGAHRNVGLGHTFLRHIERARVLVFVVDLADAPVSAMASLVTELERYRAGLARRPALVIGNKADIVPASVQGLEDLRQWLAAQEYRKLWRQSEETVDAADSISDVPRWNVVPLSAKYRANLPSLLMNLRELIDKCHPASSKWPN